MLPHRAASGVTTVWSATIDRTLGRMVYDLVVRTGPGGAAASTARGH